MRELTEQQKRYLRACLHHIRRLKVSTEETVQPLADALSLAELAGSTLVTQILKHMQESTQRHLKSLRRAEELLERLPL